MPTLSCARKHLDYSPRTWPPAHGSVTVITICLLALSFQLAADRLSEPKFLLTWGKRGSAPGEFFSPIGIALNKKDEVFVTDLNNARVQKFTSNGNYLGGFDLPLDAPPRKSTIIGGIAVDEKGLIYLSFMNQNKIAVYDETGRVVREWGKLGKGDGELHQPGGIQFLPGNALYVTDQCNHRVQKFTRDGVFLGKWGGYGSAPGQFGGPEREGSRFAGPHFISRDKKGRLYTTEGSFGRIQQFSPDGTPLLAWGSKGNEPGGFGSYSFSANTITFGPVGVAVDKRGRVWVSSLNDRVQAFTPEGKYLYGITTSGKDPGQLSKPHGMAFDSKGNLYVADASNQRIQKFAIP